MIKVAVLVRTGDNLLRPADITPGDFDDIWQLSTEESGRFRWISGVSVCSTVLVPWYPRADQLDTCLSPRQGTIAGMNSAYLELDLVPLVTDNWGHEYNKLLGATDK